MDSVGVRGFDLVAGPCVGGFGEYGKWFFAEEGDGVDGELTG